MCMRPSGCREAPSWTSSPVTRLDLVSLPTGGARRHTARVFPRLMMALMGAHVARRHLAASIPAFPPPSIAELPDGGGFGKPPQPFPTGSTLLTRICKPW